MSIKESPGRFADIQLNQPARVNDRHAGKAETASRCGNSAALAAKKEGKPEIEAATSFGDDTD